MDYRLIRLSDNVPIDALDAHVFARAYVAAWRALYECEPVNRHVIESLGLAIDFGPAYGPDFGLPRCRRH